MPAADPPVRYLFLTDPSDDHIAGILELYRRAGWWDGAEDPEQVRAIVRGSHCFVLAVENGRVVGMGRAVSDAASDAYIQDVTVLPDRNGRGIGTAVVMHLVERLEKDGIFWIGLIAENRSHPFYARMGFEPMKNARPMLYRGRGS